MTPRTSGEQFASLTYQGKLYYADRVKSGAKHPEAFKDARYSYGTTNRPRSPR